MRSGRPIFEVLEELVLLSGSISGTLWDDTNGDGQRQAGEGGLAGETVSLDLNGDHQDAGTVTSFTATPSDLALAPSAFGGVQSSLAVQGLPSRISGVTVSMDVSNSGSSPVLVALASPVGLSVPDFPTIFELQPGEHFVGTFDQNSPNPVTLAPRPLAPGTYRPQQAFTDPPAHYLDSDPNGSWTLLFFGDTSGLTLGRWSLGLRTPEPTTQTDANGNYAFTGLDPGTYRVVVPLNPADGVATPAGATQTVTVGAGQAVTGVDFGIQAASDVTGTAFDVVGPATGWGQPVTINYTLTNPGAGDAGLFDVELRLSSSGVIDSSGALLQTIHVAGLAAHASTSGAVTVRLPVLDPGPGDTVPSVADTEIGLLIDPAHALAHDDHSNASNQGPGLDMASLGTLVNTPVAPSGSVAQDPSIAVDPSDPKHLVVAAMDQSAPHSQAGYMGLSVRVSHDGGASWTATPLTLPAGFGGGAADPVVAFGPSGQVYLSFTAATFLGPNVPALTDPDSNERLDGFQSNNGIFVAVSTDGGTTWGPASAVVSHPYTGSDVFFETKPSLAVDTFATLPNGKPNPYYGDVDVTWSRYYPDSQFPGLAGSVGGSDVMIATSHDGGATWLTRTQTEPGTGLVLSAIKDPNPAFGSATPNSSGYGFLGFSQVSIGPAGDVYVSAYDGGDFVVFHSADGGASFVAPDRTNQTGVPFPGFNSEFSPDNFRTNPVRDIVADPAHPGRVYVVEANSVTSTILGYPIDPGEIYFARSDDYGQTWETIFQVGRETTNLSDLKPGQDDQFLSVLNDDNGGRDLAFTQPSQLGNEVITGQALPSMAIDAQGNLTVIWYDTRRDPTFTNLDVYGAVSTDGGATFTPNFRITDMAFNPNAGTYTDAEGNPDYYLGDHIAVAAADGFAFAAWTDTRSGTQQVEFQRYRMTPAPAPPVDRFSPNFTAQAAAVLGTVTVPQEVPRLALGPLGNAWFQVTSGATGALAVTATPAFPGAGLVLQLTDAQGNVLPATTSPVLGSDGSVLGTQLVYPSVAGQTYLIHVSGQSSSGVDYSLVIGSLTGDLGTSVQGTQAGTLAAGGEDLYRLQAGVSGSLVVTLGAAADGTGSGTAPSFNLTVLSSDGQTVLASGVAVAAGQQVALPVTQGEVVLIEVTGADASTSGGYRFGYTNLDQFETPGVSTLFVPTGNNPSAIAVAPLGRDGLNDIVVSNTGTLDTATVLTGNSDGTFQAPRQYDLGPGLSRGKLIAGDREIGVLDTNHDGAPDLVVPNFLSGDVSLLLNQGDGTFQPQRRFTGTDTPNSLTTGNFAGHGNIDIAVLQDSPQFGSASKFSVLLGRGDGTFLPPVTYSTAFTLAAFPIRAGDFRGTGRDDLVVFSGASPLGEIFLNNGDGTFRPGGTFSTGEDVFNAQCVNLGDGHLDLVVTGTNSGNVYLIRGNGDGTFQPPVPFRAMAPAAGSAVGVYGLAVADFGSPAPKSGPVWGAPDGVPDLVVTAAPRDGSGTAEALMLPGLTDAQGHFTGFGAPVVLASLTNPGKVAVGNFGGDAAPDLAITEQGGVLVIYGSPRTLATNATPQTARNLGEVPHLETSPQAIVSGHQDAYLSYTVPTEAPGTGASDQVVDFSALFQDTSGGGLQMVVTDASTGRVLGTGARFRVVAAQGEVLTIHVFAQADAAGTPGSGVYTLDIDVLPQVVAVAAESVMPGGPATSLVLSLQGDRLDPTAAENPANYTVTWLGPDGLQGSADDQVIPVVAIGGAQAVVYDPGANLDVSNGLTYATAVGQTITLLFAHPLPAGSYEIRVAPNVQAAGFSSDEQGLLAGPAALDGHPMVSQHDGIIANGVSLVAANMVAPAGSSFDTASIGKGTRFLTQLQSDLSALLDELLVRRGDDPALTALLNNQILARFAPALAAAGAPTFTIVWFDPVSIDLQAPQGGISYSASSNVASSSLGQSFVSVGGNVEVIVMANMAGTFNVGVGNVGDSARGGAVLLSGGSSQLLSFTDALRGGESSFQLSTGDLAGGETGGGGTPEGPSPAPGGGTVASSGTPGGLVGGLSQLATSLTATLLIGGPLGADPPSSSPVGTAAAAPAAASAPSGPPGASSGNELNRGRSRGRSDLEGLLLQNVLDQEALGRWRDALRSALQLVRLRLARISGVMKALGMKPRSAVGLLWDGLLQTLNRRNAQAAPAGGQAPRAQGNGGRTLPNAPALPAGDGAALGGPRGGEDVGVDLGLWDQSLERLMSRPDLIDELAAEQSPTTYVYWAALVAAVQVGQLNRRIRIRVRPRDRSVRSRER